LDHLHEDLQPAELRVREGSGGSELSDGQLHCTSPVPRPSPLGCARSGPLLPASAGLSAHLFPPLCLLYLCGLCPCQKKILAREAGVGLFASAEWCSDGLTFEFFGGVGAVGSPSRRPRCLWNYGYEEGVGVLGSLAANCTALPLSLALPLWAAPVPARF